jgi:transposase
MREDAPQRVHVLRDLFNAIRYVVRTGCQWRFLPHELPPWTAVYQQARRWVEAGVFEHIAHDLRAIVRFLSDRNLERSAAIFEGRTLQSTPESGDRAGYDGAKKKKGSKIHAAVGTLGNLLAVKTTPANEQERAQVAKLAKKIRRLLTKTLSSCSSTKDIPAKMQHRRLSRRESGWRLLSILKPSVVLSCCRDAGWLNEPLAGLVDFADWRGTTSD